MPDGEEASLSSFHPCQDYNSSATILNHHTRSEDTWNLTKNEIDLNQHRWSRNSGERVASSETIRSYAVELGVHLIDIRILSEIVELLTQADTTEFGRQ
jgi:hypothetical protein